MKNKRFKIASDMLDLIKTISKVEPDEVNAYQYEHYARMIIFKLATNKSIKSILQELKEDTEEKIKNNSYNFNYIADDNAREFFKMYLDSLKNKKPLRLAYYLHNFFKGDENLKELQEKYKKLKNEFFK